jgi:YaiO family outer membrane protein
MKLYHLSAPLLIGLAASVDAGTVPPTKKIADLRTVAASLDSEYLSYSDAFGSRRIVNGTTVVDLGKTNLSLGIAQGTRKASGDKFHATRITATLVHDWSSRVSTRTSASIAGNQPVFVTRDLVQEVSYKPLPQTVLTVGGRYSRYFGGVDATSWSIGAAQYFRGGMAGYRYSSYNVQHLGHTAGHLVNLKVNDRLGSNQLWLGHGTALHDAIWLPTPKKGKFTSVELRRVQPIGGGVGVMLGVNRAWYDTGSTKFTGTGVRLGLTFAD